MKRLFITLLMIVAAVVNMSAYVFIEKDFIKKHDVDKETMGLKSENPIDFWESMAKNNQSFQKFYGKHHKNEKASKKYQDWKNMWPKFDITDSTVVLKNLQAEIYRIASRVGITDSIAFHVVNDSSFNSASLFANQGDAVILTKGLLNDPEMTDEMIAGVIAHHYAHIYLNHILQNSALRGKVQLGSALLGGFVGGTLGGMIIGGIGTVTTGYAIGTAISSTKQGGVNMNGLNVNYYREMVLEADLIAYRFMEWSGIGGEHYIKLLRLIGSKDPEHYIGDENDFYTCHQQRISFINYVKSHPEI